MATVQSVNHCQLLLPTRPGRILDVRENDTVRLTGGHVERVCDAGLRLANASDRLCGSPPLPQQSHMFLCFAVPSIWFVQERDSMRRIEALLKLNLMFFL